MCFVRYSITIEPVIIISSPNPKAYTPFIVSVGRKVVGDTWCKFFCHQEAQYLATSDQIHTDSTVEFNTSSSHVVHHGPSDISFRVTVLHHVIVQYFVEPCADVNDKDATEKRSEGGESFLNLI